MADFSYQQNESLILDQSVFFPYPTTTTTSFSHFHQHDQVSEANKFQGPGSSTSIVLDDQKLSRWNKLLENTTKDKKMCLDTPNRLKKQKKNNVYQVDKKKKNIMRQCFCDPTGAIGYVHVRAKRGQATDSHSLAERARRERISEKMKLLQALVPGCDKVSGKAIILDVITNYIQSLKEQVEVLSMKLASLNPITYDSEMDLDAMLKPHLKMISMVHPIMPTPALQQSGPNGGPSATTFAPAADNYSHSLQFIHGSEQANSQLLQESQLPYFLSQVHLSNN